MALRNVATIHNHILNISLNYCDDKKWKQNIIMKTCIRDAVAGETLQLNQSKDAGVEADTGMVTR
ncbi:MAG: hypothetical protein ACYCVP_05810 [Thermoplasmataceae archaeon]